MRSLESYAISKDKEPYVNKKAKGRATRSVKSFSPKTLTAKQARGVKGGGVPGRLKWQSITLKRGLTSE